MFDNILTSIGINALKIDTVVKRTSINPQDILEGIIKIKSGNSKQVINKIQLRLLERYENPDKKSDFTILENELQTFTLHNKVIIHPKEDKTEYFKFDISRIEFKSNPDHLVLQTHAYITHSVDAYDEDIIMLK